MSLAHFLYRCPLCGHDPTASTGKGAACAACGAEFTPRGGRIQLTTRSAAPERVTAADLAARIDAFGGPWSAAKAADGSVAYSASASISAGTGARPIRWKGQVMGFTETMDPPRPGVVQVTDRTLAFRLLASPTPSATQGDPFDVSVPLNEVRAVQTSSSTVQIGLTGNAIYAFRFDIDSPRRWEILLRELIRREYRREGRGAILEFQPRIVTG